MRSNQKSQHRGMWGVSGVLIAWVASACSGEPLAEVNAPDTLRTLQQEAYSTQKVLILGSSVSGGDQSREAQAAASLGHSVEVVSPEQWRAMKAQQFMRYRALIIGDAACQGGTDAFQAAVDSRSAWGHIVDGNVVIIGADPSTNNTPNLVENAIAVAVERPRLTGLYVALGCAYKDAPAGTPVPLLEKFGTFQVAGVGCANSGHLFSMAPGTLSQQLADDALAGNGCTARSVFTQYPDRNFAYAALGKNSNGTPVPGQQTYTDYSTPEPTLHTGTPYVLVQGAMAAGAGCGLSETPAGEECDLGDNLNGQRALPGQGANETCSWSCRNNWCGDGVVDTLHGEECDAGHGNGRTRDSSGDIGECSASCKIVPPPSSHPPVARCKDVAIVARDACGFAADVNDGSSDQDNDLVGCTPSVAGPYGIGSTSVTLTCTDAAGHSASCTATVSIQDRVVPTLTLAGPSSAQAECGGQYNDAGANANDLCAGDMTGAIVKTGTVDASRKGTYTVRYEVTDSAGNSATPKTRQVQVADTLAPNLTLKGAATLNAECGVTYTELGATAHDQCAGPLTNAIVTSGSVDASVPGDYEVTFRVTDPDNHSTTVTRKVRVRDTTPPAIVCPAPIVTEILEGGLTSVTPGEATAMDTCDRGVRVAAPQDSVFPLGETTLTYTATDASGNRASCTSTVTVMSRALPEAPKPELWDGALLGGGHAGCSASGNGASSLAVLGLVALSLLKALRKRHG
ncbi:DUF5011 domain-containing protein [Hyalangium rubrum]|uniref:DUF5011 domain-containing protein n=1 Tax=Hyalangium rubrum TaxID=3103134 RepID=A0ABU5H9X6_9BACT|nr:DUF5011 domain-containing protein [Hyalangium sp. s54d21]MDY7229572.1 DUF5011 domain-containing protein [Hyalangium sp. s54d21]